MSAPRPAGVDEADWAAVQGELARISGNSGGVPLDKLISAKPEDLGNDANLELLWAEKAYKHAEAYWGILRALPDKTKIKLTQIDEHIYTHMRTEFPHAEFQLSPLTDDGLKSAAGKVAWRSFCTAYDKHASIADYNMGTLLRLDASRGYEPDNTTIVPRIQFFAIEIARNREGANDQINKNSPP